MFIFYKVFLCDLLISFSGTVITVSTLGRKRLKLVTPGTCQHFAFVSWFQYTKELIDLMRFGC